MLGEAAKKGYSGSKEAGPDVFMAGHSLGGVCAATLAQHMSDVNTPYNALVLMGSYVTDQKVETYPIPVLTLGAELDGGLGRPGNLYRSLESSNAAGQGAD